MNMSGSRDQLGVTRSNSKFTVEKMHKYLNSNLHRSDNMAGFSHKRAAKDHKYQTLDQPPEHSDDGELVEQAEMPDKAAKKNKFSLPLGKVTKAYASHISTQ
jgi:hypothetical protein